MNPLDGTLLDLRDAIAARKVSAREVAHAAVARAQSLQGTINAFTEVLADRALADAAAIDGRIASGSPSDRPLPLAGVPVVVKDNLCLAWGKTTCASRILENYHSPYTATAVQRLIDAGAVIIGKANLDEFAMGSGSERSIFGPTRNPWDPSRIPGGSSGGSAACVSAHITPGALGSDTGGSIRQPASMCGIVGFKPTYGRVSRYGLVAYASSLDQVGPMARAVTDAALLAEVICAHDPHDSTSSPDAAFSVMAMIDQPIPGLRVGVPKQARSSANHPGVAAALDRAIAALRDQGAAIIDVDLPHAEHGIAAYYIIALAEASSNLARFDGVRYGRRAELKPGEDLFDMYCRSRSEGLGAEVQQRIMLGTHVLSSGYYDAYYATAQKVRRLIKQDFDAVLRRDSSAADRCDALLMPSAPTPAWTIGAKASDPLSEYLEDVYTVGVNLAGVPAINVPAGFAQDNGRNLPVGVQLIGAMNDDARLLRIARTLERGLNLGQLKPPL